MNRGSTASRAFAVLLAVAAVALALATAPPRVSRQVIGAGGAQVGSGNFTITGTVGQTAVGRSPDLWSGYWHPPAGTSSAPLVEIPSRPGLHGNAPNPFNPVTTISYTVGTGGGQVRLRIFDIHGRLVRNLVEGVETPGSHTVVWRGDDRHGLPVASGTYFCRLETNDYTEVHKMLLLK